MRLEWKERKLMVRRGEGTRGRGNLRVEVDNGRAVLRDGNIKIAEVYETDDGYSLKVLPSKFFGSERPLKGIVAFIGRFGTLAVKLSGKVEKTGENFYFLGSKSLEISFAKSPRVAFRRLLKGECKLGIFGDVLDARNMRDEEIIESAEGYDGVVIRSKSLRNPDWVKAELEELGVDWIESKDVFFPSEPEEALLRIGDRIPVPDLGIEKGVLKYQMFESCEVYGYPIVPLFFRFSSREAFGMLDEFMSGDLLIAPLKWHGRGVFVPKGKWMDLESLEILESGWRYTETPLTLLREGGIAILEEEDHIKLVVYGRRAKKRIHLGRCERDVEMVEGEFRFGEGRGCGRMEVALLVRSEDAVREVSIGLNDGEKRVRVF